MSEGTRWLARVPAAEMEGLELTSPRWVLSGVARDASLVFGAIPEWAPEGAFVFIEGGAHPRDLRQLLENAQVSLSSRPALGTSWPRQKRFAVPATAVVLHEISKRVRQLAESEVCDHLHVFTECEILLSGYDAFSQPFLLSGSLREEQVERFAASVGLAYSAYRA